MRLVLDAKGVGWLLFSRWRICKNEQLMFRQLGRANKTASVPNIEAVKRNTEISREPARD